MFNPDLRNVLKNKTSRYSLVTAVAKRAREISGDAQENGEILNYFFRINQDIESKADKLLNKKSCIEDIKDGKILIYKRQI